MHAFVTGVAVWGAGLPGWAASAPILAGTQAYLPVATPPPLPPILSANERRRTGLAVRLALTVAQQAMEMAGEAFGSVRSVFGCANGDGAVVHGILEVLASDDRQVSPTQFHNSVHNAAAGYWTIATGSREAATSLGCHDATFAAALLKAMAELTVERRPVLLCVYDAALPEPLLAKRHTGAAFAAALVLAPEQDQRAFARVAVRYRPEIPEAEAERPLLEGLRDIAAAIRRRGRCGCWSIWRAMNRQRSRPACWTGALTSMCSHARPDDRRATGAPGPRRPGAASGADVPAGPGPRLVGRGDKMRGAIASRSRQSVAAGRPAEFVMRHRIRPAGRRRAWRVDRRTGQRATRLPRGDSRRRDVRALAR